MTLAEIMKSEKDMLTPTDVAEVLGVNAYSINLQAKDDVRALGFPASKVGTRVRIPRLGFINWFNGKGE